jgi:hypothetical protein
MHMVLNRLIPQDESHSTIAEHKPQTIFVIPGNMTTYRIPIRKMPAPARITISYLDGRIRGITPDLKVWVSLSEPIPQDQKCD